MNFKNLGLGVGLRSKHFQHLMQENQDLQVDWFEIISENFMDNFGYARHVLGYLAARRPIVMHGVSLSIGSSDPLNMEYLKSLKELAEFVQPEWISDHLCWTGVAHVNTHDLLPMPLTKESLQHVVARIQQVQEYLGRPLILENPSTYLEYTESTMEEWEFLSQMALQSGCGLLLDVNNVYVSSYNHGFDPEHYIKNLPHDQIVQMHLAGPTDCGDYLVDTHDQPVPTRVWELYKLAQELTGGVSTLLEWDADIPDFPDLVKELQKAKGVMLGFMPQEEVKKGNELTISNPVDFSVRV